MSSIPATQTAFHLNNKTHSLDKVTVPVPKPGPGNVLLKIAAAGVCHSDLHVLYGAFPHEDGMVLGHEIAGYIAAYGEGVDAEKYPKSSLYAVHCSNPCGTCELCRTGRDNICEHPSRQHFGLGHPGGYQQYTQLSPRNLTQVPEGISPAIAATSTDAVLTPYHALKLAGVNGQTNLLLIGMGGLGINGVQIAKAFGSKVTALDVKASSRQLAKKFGADAVYETLPADLPKFDVVVDFVGAQQTFSLAQKHVKANGIIMPVGLQDPTLTFSLPLFSLREFKIFGIFAGNSQEQVEIFELIRKGLVTPQIETTSYLNVNKVLNDLHEGKVNSRMVLIQE